MNAAALGNEDNASAPVLYMALELSNKNWRLTFGGGGKRRQVSVPAADLMKLSEAVAKAKERFGMPASTPVVSCYEAGRDGFWLHRHLKSVGIENEVIDAASIEVSRRLRHVKTDRLDGERLLDKLMRHHAGERGGWSVVRVPSVEEEDARRLHRELERLKRERLAHRVRVQSLLVIHGLRVTIKSSLRLGSLTLWDGRALPAELKAELEREVERLTLVERQIAALESARRERLREPKTEAERSIVQLMRLGAIGPTSAWLLVMEFFGWRGFRNRREVAALAGLVGSPYNSGESERDQGISKAGNRRVRAMMVEIAWLWLRFQPKSALSQWYHRRFAGGGLRMRRIGIVALARRLLIALWRYLADGVIPEGARLIASQI
ncbi:MAG: IS110 family transposase [Betaproteobacteria bacterium]|nr:IS110 family transposase [Betaproteobacteria bacterium]